MGVIICRYTVDKTEVFPSFRFNNTVHPSPERSYLVLKYFAPTQISVRDQDNRFSAAKKVLDWTRVAFVQERVAGLRRGFFHHTQKSVHEKNIP